MGVNESNIIVSSRIDINPILVLTAQNFPRDTL